MPSSSSVTDILNRSVFLFHQKPRHRDNGRLLIFPFLLSCSISFPQQQKIFAVKPSPPPLTHRMAGYYQVLSGFYLNPVIHLPAILHQMDLLDAVAYSECISYKLSYFSHFITYFPSFSLVIDSEIRFSPQLSFYCPLALCLRVLLLS
jgi:hypothetical protein